MIERKTTVPGTIFSSEIKASGVSDNIYETYEMQVRHNKALAEMFLTQSVPQLQCWIAAHNTNFSVGLFFLLFLWDIHVHFCRIEISQNHAHVHFLIFSLFLFLPWVVNLVKLNGCDEHDLDKRNQLAED